MLQLEPAPGPRNLLVLHCHDLGRFLGTYGVDSVCTPHLDALASEGTVFDAAYATSPHCSPARASLFTGEDPQRHGVLGLTHNPFNWDLNDPSQHLAHHLHSEGFFTELIGVHHESREFSDDRVAERLGFDRVRTGGLRDVVVERAIEALRGAAEDSRRFYLQVGFHEPHRTPSPRDDAGIMGFLADGVDPDSSRGVHVPAYLRDTAEARAEIAELQGAVRAMDQGVGQILSGLAELGLADDTLVVFTTDHGVALPRAKCTLYDAGTGVALMLRVPGRDRWKGRRVTSLVSHTDVVPTVCELLGTSLSTPRDGSSFVATVEHGTTVREMVFTQLSHHTYDDPKRSIRTPDWNLIVNFSNAPVAMDPTQSWMHRSLPTDLAGPSVRSSPVLELYDLRNDPDELTNRSADPHLEPVVGRLADELLDWMRRTDDPLLEPAPASPRLTAALDALHAAAGHAPTDDILPSHHDPVKEMTQ